MFLLISQMFYFIFPKATLLFGLGNNLVSSSPPWEALALSERASERMNPRYETRNTQQMHETMVPMGRAAANPSSNEVIICAFHTSNVLSAYLVQ